MPNLRLPFRALACAFVALGVLAVPVIAAELLGSVKEVDVDARKIVVTEKGTDHDVTVTIDDKTTFETPKGKTLKKFDLAKLKKGARLKITHEDGVASKIVLQRKGAGKKKAEPKPE